MYTSQKVLSVFAVVVGIFSPTRLAAAPSDADPPSQQSIRNIHQAHWAFQYQQRAFPLDAIPGDARTRALQQSESAKSRIARHGPLAIDGARWVNIGPAPIVNGQIVPPGPVSGRVICISVDPANAARWLIGTAQGGIWETRDSGATWAPKTDDQASLAIGALAFAPSSPSVIYAGTGEGHFSDSYSGAGMLKSLDGGSTWQLLAAPLFSGKSFSSILIHPANPTSLLTAVTAYGGAGPGFYHPPTQPGYGVFKSTDGGATWNQRLTGFAMDLKADPANFNHQMATAAHPNSNSQFDLFRSLDAGDTWTVVDGPWKVLGGVGRMQVAVSPSNPSTVYVSAADTRSPETNTNYNRLLGIWRGDNVWAAAPAWTRLPQPADVEDQLFYDQVISVDPANQDILYFGDTGLRKYNGTTWVTVGGDYDANTQGRFFHPDQHALTWAGTRLIIGNDGGVWSTTDGGVSFVNHNSNLSLTQFYFGSVHPRNRNVALGGEQDNGSARWLGTDGWSFAGFGDGADNAISPDDPDNKWIVSSQSMAIYRVTGAGLFRSYVFPFNIPNKPFIARLAIAPGDEDVVVTGATRLIRTTNFFSAPNVPDWFYDSPELQSAISALVFAPTYPGGETVAFGTANGQIWLNSPGNGPMNIDAGDAVPNRYVTALAFHPQNANLLYVALSGFDEGTPGKPGHLFKSANALSAAPTWVNISPPVNLPHNAIVIDPANPTTLYVGTDIGVWQSTDGGGNWNHMGPQSGMPNVAVFDLEIQPATGRVFAFTHGRGAFMLDPNAVNEQPTITGFAPAGGPAGTSVTIAGTKFNNATSVRFGNVAAGNFTINSSTQLVATVPAGAITGPISVTTPTGTATSAVNFTVNTTPAIANFAPASGNVGTIVTITGVNLTGATNVSFNNSPSVFVVESAVRITATVPPGATTGKIRVSTPAGTDQSAAVFTVTATPVISGFNPVAGAIGATVTINGANFVNVNRVAFNGVPAVNPVVNSPGQITALVPAGANNGPISVTTANGTIQSADNFIVIPTPAIAGFGPVEGSVGTTVTITGTGFTGATAVTFNGLNAMSFNVAAAAQIIAVAPAGVTTGPIRVTTPGGTAVSPNPFTALAPPANDNFANAQIVTASTGTVSGTNVAASKEPQEPAHADDEGGKSVWYRWVAPGDGTWIFDTRGSSFNTLLAVYTGGTLANLVAVADNDNIPGTNTSSLAFVAGAGNTYWIAVDGFLGDPGEGAPNPVAASGSIVLNWSPAAEAPPQISDFSPTAGTPGTSVLINGVNFLGTTGVTFNAVSAVFTVNSNLQITATVPVGATTGPIRVLKPGGASTSGASFTVRAGQPNDNFASAQVIAGNAGTVTAGNASATKEPGEPNHAGNVGGTSLWYAWTAPGSGTWRFDTSGSSFDTLLAVYTGSNVGGLALVAANDDSAGQTSSQVTFNATAGNIYRVAVDGYGAATGNLILNWALTSNLPIITGFSPVSGGVGSGVTINGTNFTGANTVRFGGVSAPVFSVNSEAQIIATVPAGAVSGPISVTTSNGTALSAANFTITGSRPLNDNFAARVAITGTATVTGSSAGASKETGEPNHAANTGGASVWWAWTAPGAGTYTITTRGSSFDTVLGVYSGLALDALAPVASNDDGPGMGTASQVSIVATPGATYQIAVDGYNGASGNIILSVYPSTAPQTIYATRFEAAEGFSTQFNLDIQNAWTRSGSGQNGIVFNYFLDASQQAYLGVSSATPGNDVYLWRPLNFNPDTNNRPVVVFSTVMEIVDSTDGRYDDFGWDVYNRDGNRLFFLDFDNNDLGIYYELNDGTGYHATGRTFQNGRIYSLEVNMDFARNLWSATLDDLVVVERQPLSATNNVALNLGDLDATWLQLGGTYGNNFMLFDNYSVTAMPGQVPRLITSPQSQTVTVGAGAAFLVVVDSPLPVTYQWQFNGVDIPGANAATLTLDNITFAQAGAYRVRVVNVAGPATSTPALLTVAQQPDVAPYKPTAWSDKLVVATDPSGTSDAVIIYDHQDVYIDWAVLNSSTNGNISSRFYTQLFLDGVLQQTWFTDGLNAGFYSFVTNHNLGRLVVGTHTFRIDTDTTGVVSESDENNNVYSRTWIVSSTNSVQPQLGSSSLLANGRFEFTLIGIPLRSYEIQTSTNLPAWSPLGTLVITNGNGLLQFSDPVAPNLDRRFYRARLLSP